MEEDNLDNIINEKETQGIEKIPELQQKKSKLWVLLLIIPIVILIVTIPEKSITCYEDKIIIEKIPYDTTETYYETIASKSCDTISGCSCLHYSWGGLGACDSCNCRKTRIITKYRNEEKTIQEPYTKQVNWLYGECNA